MCNSTSDVEGKNCIFNQRFVKLIKSSVRESKSMKTICHILFTAPASLRFCLFYIFRKYGHNKYNLQRKMTDLFFSFKNSQSKFYINQKMSGIFTFSNILQVQTLFIYVSQCLSKWLAESWSSIAVFKMITENKKILGIIC